MEPRDGVDPSWLHYGCSAGAGRRGVVRWFGTEVSILVRTGSEPGELAAASRARFGLEVSNPAGRLQRPASSPEAPDHYHGARRGSRTRLSWFGRPAPLPLGQTRVSYEMR